MIIKTETKYYHGNEVSEEEYKKTIDAHSHTVTIETDLLGRERITKDKGGLLERTFKEEGFKDDYNDGLDTLGAVGGAVIAPVILSGIVVYNAGKLIFRLATIKKRIRENEELDERMREDAQSFFEKQVEKTLSYYNKKLAEYKELLELGILTENEYNTYVQEYIKMSNQEIDKHRKYLEESLERYKEKNTLTKVWNAL